MRTTFLRWAAAGVLGLCSTTLAWGQIGVGGVVPPVEVNPPAAVQVPGANVQVPGANVQTPPANVQVPGANVQTPGANVQVPGANVQTPGVNVTPGAKVDVQGSGVGANVDADLRWRYKQHNGEWWYWTPSSRWMIHRGGAWVDYDPVTYRVPAAVAPRVNVYTAPGYGYSTPGYGGYGYGNYGYGNRPYSTNYRGGYYGPNRNYGPGYGYYGGNGVYFGTGGGGVYMGGNYGRNRGFGRSRW